MSTPRKQRAASPTRFYVHLPVRLDIETKFSYFLFWTCMSEIRNRKFVSISSLTGKCIPQKFKNFCSSSLWTCLHHIVILRSQSKITVTACRLGCHVMGRYGLISLRWVVQICSAVHAIAPVTATLAGSAALSLWLLLVFVARVCINLYNF